jgi:hypothetical protein
LSKGRHVIVGREPAVSPRKYYPGFLYTSLSNPLQVDVQVDPPQVEQGDVPTAQEDATTPRSSVPPVLKAQEDSPRKGFICPDCKHVAATPEELMVHYETHLADHGALLKRKAQQESAGSADAANTQQVSNDAQVHFFLRLTATNVCDYILVRRLRYRRKL